jgi:hypothetical protein
MLVLYTWLIPVIPEILKRSLNKYKENLKMLLWVFLQFFGTGIMLVWGHGLGDGVVRCVVWFSAGFPYKLSKIFSTLSIKGIADVRKIN